MKSSEIIARVREGVFIHSGPIAAAPGQRQQLEGVYESMVDSGYDAEHLRQYCDS
jgi:hypothetical protein